MRCALLFSAAALAVSSCLAQTTAPAPAPHTRSCPVDARPPSDAEVALAREDESTAISLFEAMATTSPDLSRAGVIRAKLAQDKVSEARKLAEDWTAEQPANAAALETLAEAQLRDGEPVLAFETVERARALNPCLPRVHLVRGNIENLAGLFADSRALYELAHKLAPQDPDIQAAWVSTLPRPQRIAESELLAKNEHLFTEKQRKELAVAIEYDKQHEPGECSVTGFQDHAVVPIRGILDGPTNVVGLALDLSFDGKRRRLELDTGASGIVLSRSGAGGLALIREEKVRTGGVGDKGEVDSSIAHVATIRIGNLEFHNCPVSILEKRSALDIDGLIGGDVFRKFLVTIDYPKSELRLDPLPPRPGPSPEVQAAAANDEDMPHNRYIAPTMQDWTKIWRSGHELLIPVSIGGTKDRLFLIDTGAGLMSISPAAAREVTKVHHDPNMGVRGLSGEVAKVYETDGFLFAFAHLRQKVNNMTAFDTTKISHGTGLEVSGFLGAPILQRLTIHIDYRDNLVKFDYDPNNDNKFRTPY